jgi:hypothetical protein
MFMIEKKSEKRTKRINIFVTKTVFKQFSIKAAEAEQTYPERLRILITQDLEEK